MVPSPLSESAWRHATLRAPLRALIPPVSTFNGPQNSLTFPNLRIFIAAALAAASGLATADFTDPCAEFNGGAVATAVESTAHSSAAETTAADTTAVETGAAATTSKKSGSGVEATGGASSASTSTAAAATSAKPNSATGNVGAGLKVYIGFALVGALAVLNL